MKLESFNNTSGEIIKSTKEHSGSRFDPDRRIDIQNRTEQFNNPVQKIDPDRRLDTHHDSTEEKKPEVMEKSEPEYYTTKEERIKKAASSDGVWLGEPGNSKFIPNKSEAKEGLRKFGQDGIEYKDGEPDFSPVSVVTVEIGNMTSKREKNFKAADEKYAAIWNKEARDGRTDWTGHDVKDWRKQNRYSWHERLDRKTMDLVQRDVHNECQHYGGVYECKCAEKALEGGFDE